MKVSLLRATLIGIVGLIGLTVMPAQAQEFNLRPTGGQIDGGSGTATLYYEIDIDDILVAREFTIQVTHSRGSSPTGSWYLDIILGHESDGVNCASGGSSCTGKCRVKIDGIDHNGTCTNNGSDDNGAICACSTVKAASFTLGAAPAPGDLAQAAVAVAEAVQHQAALPSVETLAGLWHVSPSSTVADDRHVR